MDPVANPDPNDQPPTPEAARFLAALQLMQQRASPAPAGGGLPPATQDYLNRSVANVGPAPQADPTQPIATPAQGMVAPVAPPTAPDPPSVAPPTQPKPGPIKSLLSSLLYGAGQSLVHRAGLPTDLEKQTLAQNQARAQQGADDTSQYKQAITDLTVGKGAQLDALNKPVQVPNNPAFGQAAGQTVTHAEFTGMLKTLAQNSGKLDVANVGADAKKFGAEKGLEAKKLQYGSGQDDGSVPYTRRGFANIGGKYVTYDKADPMNTMQPMGASDPLVSGVARAGAFAQARAQFTPFDTTDDQANPTTISVLDALKTGAAKVPYGQAKGTLSDLVGVKQYESILKTKIAPNLSVLSDNSQRIAIAHTLAEVHDNPGMAQAIVTSALQERALSSQGAALVAGILQGREFGGVARKYGGNMNGTEGLMDRIMANQASPLNSEAVNHELIANDLDFTDKAQKTIGGLLSHNAGKVGASSGTVTPPPPSPSAPPSSDPYAKFKRR